MTRTNRVLLSLAAALAAVGGVQATAAQSLGGFPIREPGRRDGEAAAPRHKKEKLQQEVIVSQGPKSEVDTIAKAMARVAPGGSILVQGGTYYENVVVTKPVSISGIEDAYGREPVIRASAGAPCVSIAPDTALAAVTLSRLVFEFDDARPSEPCIDIRGGVVAVRDTFIMPEDAGISRRAAFGSARAGLQEDMLRPPRDRAVQGPESYYTRHAQPVGALNPSWDLTAGGTSLERFMHARTAAGAGILSGPAAGIRVTAGEARLDGNVIVGAMRGVAFESRDGARIRGEVSNNILIGNGVGLFAVGRDAEADLLLTRNTIRYNAGPGVQADVYDGLKVLANEISGNESGILLSENVRLGTINSNLIVANTNDAMKISTGFFGAVGGNTIADNGGCTVQFYSAEQKILNAAEIKMTAFDDFRPRLTYEPSNYAVDNDADALTKDQRKRRHKGKSSDSEYGELPKCGGAIETASR